MAHINIDFTQKQGKIKPMHAVGQPPFTGGFGVLDFSPLDHIKKANIPYSRLHDVGGAFGSNRFVDIPNIFRDFEADETAPASYDFAFTDALLAGMAEYDVKPIFRLGVTIENQYHIKAYHIYPPKDYGKWARICEHIIRHYNEGWADGFHYGIEYWEIWNEPDNGTPGKNQMWIGTNEQFYELYHVAATHLKACFGDAIKVGGYGACTPQAIRSNPQKYGANLPEGGEIKPLGKHRMEFLYGFFDFIKAHNSPIDFFSWHSYASVEEYVEFSKFFDRLLKQYGYEDLETMLNEWNDDHKNIRMDTSHSSAHAAATMCAMQSSPTDMLCFYDARYDGGTYGGFFNPITHQPTCLYYAFEAFGKLYQMGAQVLCESDTPKLYTVAACDDNTKGAMVVNYTQETQQVTTNFEGGKVYLIDQDHHLTLTDWDSATFTLLQDQTVYIEQ